MSRNKGFSLIELLVSLSILLVIIAVGVPSMKSFLDDGSVSTAATDFLGDVYVARANAVKLNCDVTLSPNSSWQNGWSITYSAASSTDLTCASSGGTPVTVKTHGAVAGSVVAGQTGSASYVFGGDGRASGPSAGVAFNASNTASVKERCVTIGPSGKPSTKSLARNATC